MNWQLPTSHYQAVRRRMCPRGLLLRLVFIAAAFPALAATFTASLDRGTISLGESATLSLTFQDGTPADIPAAPGVTNLTINYLGQSSQFNFINGRSSSTLLYNYLVRANQPGDYTIPAIRVMVDGRTLSSQPIRLKVLKTGEAPLPTAAAGQNAFLKLVTPKKDVYLGEVLPVEIQVYWRQANPKQAPQLAQEGFTVGKMVQNQKTVTMANNQYYNEVTFRTFVIPAKTGPLKLGPATMLFQLPAPNARVNFFGEIVDWMDVTLTNEPLTVDSRPLPTNDVPPDFNGAVGTYSLTAGISTNAVTVGDPITVTVRIQGHGPIDSLTLSSLNHWRDFKIYPPVTKVETTDQFGLDGVKTFEQAVIPENVEVKELPPITFSFFNPDRKSYQTITSPATPIIVHPARTAPAQPTIVAAATQNQNEPQPAADIVHIKPRLGTLAQIRPPLIQQSWFIALQGAPLLAWLMAVAWRRREDKLANNPRMRRQREVASLVREGLADLRRLAGVNQSEEFFALVFRLLQEQLGERLDTPASAITESVVEERLRPRGVKADTLTAVQELFQTCDQARYSPRHFAHQLEALVPKVESALRQLQRLNLDERES